MAPANPRPPQEVLLGAVQRVRVREAVQRLLWRTGITLATSSGAPSSSFPPVVANGVREVKTDEIFEDDKQVSVVHQEDIDPDSIFGPVPRFVPRRNQTRMKGMKKVE